MKSTRVTLPAGLSRHERRAARAANGGWMPLLPATPVRKTPEQIETMIAQLRVEHPDYSEERIRASMRFAYDEMAELWANDTYQVHVIPWPFKGPRGGPIIQLSIRRLDRKPCRDWRDFQRIKNQLVGEECEAVELFPAESRLVDTANQFHLWCVTDTSYRWPVGYTDGRVVIDTSVGGAVQRPRE